MHSAGIVHRHLTLENILIGKEAQIKIIHFGFSASCQPNEKLKINSGISKYMDPDIVKN